MGDIKTLSNEGEEALQGFGFLGVEAAVEERSDADVFGIVVKVGVSADPEDHCGRLAQALCRGTELGEHFGVQ